jgi:hypothetical protein
MPFDTDNDSGDYPSENSGTYDIYVDPRATGIHIENSADLQQKEIADKKSARITKKELALASGKEAA